MRHIGVSSRGIRSGSQFGQSLSGRKRTRGRPKFVVIPSPERDGKLIRQCRRCLIAHDQIAHMGQFREFCYPGRTRQHWFYINIKRALRKLGARQVGRSARGARPGIWAL